MALPVVAIIGRPNVGKSSLFNALAGEMISIVEPTAGVTRDRVSAMVGRGEKYFELIDTGGYGIVDAQQLSEHIEQQIITAIESASIVLFTVDIREGVVPLDARIAQLLRKGNLEVIGVANKADEARMFPAAGEFSKLGFGDFICVSATNNLNKQVLLDRIFKKLSGMESGRPAKPVMKIAIVGKQNVGKSSMVNAIVGSKRVIVSETPGTTRDAIDVRFEKDGKTIVVIDTAGIRKKSKMVDIDFYSFVRATKSIQRADVVLFLIDATAEVSDVDKRIARFIADEYKSCIIIINKWDLAKGTAVTGSYEDYLTKLLPGLKYAPIAFTTATDAKNVQSVLDLAAEVFKQTTTWITTGRLNKAFEAIKAESLSAGKRGKGQPKIYYATQVAIEPITILMFVNKPDLFDENHRRFIIGRLRELLPVAEVPIKLLARAHRTTSKRPGTSGKPSTSPHKMRLRRAGSAGKTRRRKG
jgi:GTP-binding protein